jgi:hypothetical protein
VDCCPPPPRDGRRAFCASGGCVLYHRVHAWVTFWVDVLDELVAEFWKQEDQRLCLERPGMMVYNLLLGPPSDRARLADRLEEATERLGAEQPT